METAELRDRFTIVEQRQMLNESVPLGLPKGNNSSDKDSSNFNFSSTSVIEEKSSEEKDIDKFLDDAHKKSVADNIRRCNKEKKFSVRRVSKM
ncbi:hypothetical protein RhiirC2_745937 [Rhizophagus irregularis]|nr:hypothetical protein RhiirC2_745937 [Rhizophagus irregularis]